MQWRWVYWTGIIKMQPNRWSSMHGRLLKVHAELELYLIWAPLIILARVKVCYRRRGGATRCPVNWKLAAATETIIHWGIFNISGWEQRRVSGAAALCVFCLILLSFPPISGRRSLLPSVMRILSKKLFNFRKAADGLCEPSSSENPTIHTCLTGVRPRQIADMKTSF